MLNICNKMADDNSACDSTAAGAALFAVYASDGRTLTGNSLYVNQLSWAAR